MIFSSLTFLYVFLPMVLLFAALFRKTSLQNVILFVASILFYAWGGASYTIILIASIVVNYLAGIAIHKARLHKKAILASAITVNLLSLVVFKYANFLVDNYNVLISFFGLTPATVNKVLLPIGISFYTFQGISYLVDVYRGRVPAQTNFIKLGAYISFFPQLIAGPIVRYHEIEAQLCERKMDVDGLYDGIKRFCLGLARKVLIANPLAVFADDVFGRAPASLTSATAWLGAIAYALQIYHDFAGYSDMAIGLGRMFGFKFPENFNLPYTSTSIREFWRRWHITLSAWFKDYLYIPLGGNRKGKSKTYLNLFVVFFLTGLWHGANWTFVVWGLMHGLFMVIERMGFGNVLEKCAKPLRHIYVLLVVCIAWVFFRADDLNYAMGFLGRMFSFNFSDGLSPMLTYYAQPMTYIVSIIAMSGSTNLFPFILEKMEISIFNGNRLVAYLRNILLPISILCVLFLVTCFLSTGGYNPFIYFRF